MTSGFTFSARILRWSATICSSSLMLAPMLGAGHRHIAIAAHADGDDALVVLVALDAFCPELAQHFGILGVVPGTLAVALPFLLGAQHGLVMGGAHDDAPLVGHFGTERIVFVEGAAPHGGPEIIALEAQDQFEDVCVELASCKCRISL